MRPLLLALALLGAACTTTASNNGADATPTDTPDGAAPRCPAGMVYVYDPGCDAPTGHCVAEVTDAGLTVPPSFCGCDGVTFYDNTGAIRPIRATGTCPTAVDAGFDAGATVDVAADAPRDCGNLMMDPSNCGGCGVVCCGAWCINAQCTAEGPPGTYACPSTEAYRQAHGCVGPVPSQIATDPANCGACGTICDAGLVCVAGECRATP